MAQGWGFPLNMKKGHYFNNSTISLCSRCMYGGELEDTNDLSDDNCAECKRRVVKLRKQQEVANGDRT